VYVVHVVGPGVLRSFCLVGGMFRTLKRGGTMLRKCNKNLFLPAVVYQMRFEFHVVICRVRSQVQEVY
jgi:hypothetical protein